MILAGDIGGTNSRLAYFIVDGGNLQQVATEQFPSNQFASLREVVEKFTQMHRCQIERAAFGVAGPVEDGVSRPPNLDWIVDSRKLAEELGLQRVGLINDLVANAHGILALNPDEFVTINEGQRDSSGNAALISAGTGLGEAGLHWEGDHYHPFASEGGHADFAPRNPVEMKMLSHAFQSHEHVSYEHFLSGPGLLNIYDFLSLSRTGPEPQWLQDEFEQADRAAVISKVGLENRDDVCARSLDMFISIYAAEAGNLALKVLATGGVYIGGGIAPKIIEKFKQPAFMDAFCAKGRMSSLMKSIPIKVIDNDRTALLGAAQVAFSERGMSAG